MTHVNLLRDDYETVAEHVHRQLQHYTGKQVLRVRPTGKVSVCRPSECAAPVEEIVGYYNRQAPIEVIENDLLLRLRELKAA